MNILIEDADTLQFLADDGAWTKNIARGKRFTATNLAFDTARKEPIGKFNIVYHVSETGQFINLNHGRGKGAETGAV